MSDDATPSLKDRLKSRLNVSLAAMVAALVGIGLLILAAAAWLVYSIDPTRIAWGDYMTLQRGVWLLVLWALSCVVTYVTVRIWMADVPLGNARVRAGWKTGMQLLSQHGVGLNQIPCFLVLGCETRHQQEAWLGSEGAPVAQSTSEGAPAIDWHLSKDRLLIFCRDIGVYGTLLRSGTSDEHSEQPKSIPDHVAEAPASPSASPSDANTSEESVADNDESSRADSTDDAPATEPQAEPLAAGATPSAVAVAQPPTQAAKTQPTSVTHAMQSLERADRLVQDAQSIQPMAQPTRSIPDSLSSVRTTQSQQELSDLCARLRAERFPHAPINGTLVMVDSRMIAEGGSSPGESGRKIGRAIRRDLDQVQSELGIASPVTMMIAEKDHPDDYKELQRRLRMVEQQSSVALGKPFVSEEIPTGEAMNQLANDTIREIENRVKQVFQVPRSLTQPQNHRLVRVLIQCRRWRSSLRSLMVESCAANPVDMSSSHSESMSEVNAPIVSGLFVASPGQRSAKSNGAKGHFFESVVAHMIDQQNHLAWTSEERQAWRRHQRFAASLMVITGLLIALFLIQLWIVLRPLILT